MLVIIPVSEADEQMVGPSSELINKLGGCPNHDLLVVGSTDCQPLVNELHAKLKGQFKDTSTHVFQCLTKGWPLGPNAYFRNTISYLYTTTNTIDQPWYWFELDNTPLKKGWLDALQKEYVAAHAVFLGARHATYYVDQNNKLLSKGYHMAGTGIYPKNFTQLCDLWRFEEGVAFDVWIQWEIIKAGLTDTPLIQHNWKTCNYRREGGEIVCDNFDMPHPDLHTNKPVSPEAVIVHGCKDLSLARLLLSELGGNKVKTNSSPVSGDVVKPVKSTTTKKKIATDRRVKKFKNNYSPE
jgi:hypothetical protein